MSRTEEKISSVGFLQLKCSDFAIHLWVYLNSKPQRIHFSITEFLSKCVTSLSPKLPPFLSFGVLPRASIFSAALRRKTIQRQLDSIERVDEYLIIGKSPPAKCELPVANIVLQPAGKGGAVAKKNKRGGKNRQISHLPRRQAQGTCQNPAVFGFNFNRFHNLGQEYISYLDEPEKQKQC